MTDPRTPPAPTCECACHEFRFDCGSCCYAAPPALSNATPPDVCAYCGLAIEWRPFSALWYAPEVGRFTCKNTTGHAPAESAAPPVAEGPRPKGLLPEPDQYTKGRAPAAAALCNNFQRKEDTTNCANCGFGKFEHRPVAEGPAATPRCQHPHVCFCGKYLNAAAAEPPEARAATSEWQTLFYDVRYDGMTDRIGHNVAFVAWMEALGKLTDLQRQLDEARQEKLDAITNESIRHNEELESAEAANQELREVIKHALSFAVPHGICVCSDSAKCMAHQWKDEAVAALLGPQHGDTK